MPIRALHLAKQLAAQRKSPELLNRIQCEKLRDLVHEGYAHTIAYRCLMQRAHVRPEDIDALDDIKRLPIVSKEDLQEFTEDQRTNRMHLKSSRAKRIVTSGSAGVPFEFDIDQSYDKWRKAQYLRPYVTNGRRPWYRVLRMTPFPNDSRTPLSRFKPYRECHISCTSSIDSQTSALQNLKPVHLQGYPSVLRCLAFELLSREISTPYVQTVFTDSELLTPDTRSLIERAFDAPVLDVYGSFETDNIAYQCSRTSEYHVTIDSVIAEVLKDGDAVIDEDGDLVVTVLRNRTTPFIRYNLRDHVRMLAQPCDCGRTFPLMKIVAGRNDDLIVCADGRRESPMSVLYRLDFMSEWVRQYQIAQTAVDEFVARIIPARPLSNTDENQVRQAIMTDYPNACVTISVVAELPRSQAAKFKVFVCEIPVKKGSARGN